MEELNQALAVEFTNYSQVDGHSFPGKITVLQELEKLEKPVLVLENIKVRRAQIADKVFAAPANAMEFDTCEKVTPAKGLQMTAPDFSNAAIRRNAGTPVINAYGIVTKDGTLENVKMVTSDAEVQQTVLETVKKWRFTPAMCGTTPVAVEREFPVFVTSDGGGNMDAGGRRGR
jgi:TonB family protein